MKRVICTVRAKKTIMDLIIVLGLVGATLTTVSLLPQLIKICRTHSTKDISTGMLVLFSSAFIVWLTYGILIGDIPLIIANTFAIVQSIIILIFKIIIYK
jgi:MtN3 and saliva related transmembrane protein